MDISQFRAGNWQKILGYKAFVPESINHAFVWRDDELNELLEKASRQIGALDVLANYVPDVDQLIRAYEYKEAVVSSRIEGTQTQLDEAFQREQDIDPEKHDDWVEVNNYVTAMNGALSDLNRLPLSSRLLRAIIELKKRRRDSVMTLGRRAGTGQKLLTHLFSQPVVRVQDVEILLSTNKKTAGELVAVLVGLGILVEMTGQRRNRLFVFDEYLKLSA